MSRNLLRRRVFSEQAFAEATRLERILMSFEDKDIVLSDSDNEYYQNLVTVHEIATKNLSIFTRNMLISKRFDITVRTAHNWVQDSITLFGNFIKFDRAFQRNALADKFIRLAKKAEKDSDIDTARRCYADYMKLTGLDKPDEEEAPTSFDAELTIEFTNDPSALKTDSIEEAILEEGSHES